MKLGKDSVPCKYILCPTICSKLFLCVFLGIEDQMNWHGKPLGAKTDEALSRLRDLIKNNGPARISPLRTSKL